MRLAARATFALLVLASLSCSEAKLPTTTSIPAPQKSITGSSGSPDIVISQVYGGGGNAGATYKNKFVELFNRSGSTISLTGWSIQYASATGTGTFGSNGVVALSGSLAPGQYYLVQVGPTGSNGAALPVTPDLVAPSTSNPNPAAGAGKLIVANTTSGITCNGSSGQPCNPAQQAQIVDLVGYGNANFFEGSAAAPTLSSSLAGFRAAGGCQDSNDNNADFTKATPAPRNKASDKQACPGTLPIGPLDHVSMVSSATVMLGVPLQLVATPKDANGQVVGTAAITWSSSNESVATVSSSGVVTGIAADPSPVTVTATAVDNGITKAASAQVTVVLPVITWIDVSTSADTFPATFQAQLFATARAYSGGPIIAATYTLEAVDPGIATITQVGSSTGIITGISGSITKPGFKITATPTAGGTPYIFVTHPVVITTPLAAPADIYGHNDELGDPTPATPVDPNDMLITRPQYTLSYNQSRGTPNWVAYELDKRQFGIQDRCNCFTADPFLPPTAQIFTSNYTGSGFDRGHMTRSADRTAGNFDNATTFYLTNVVPQQADLNQGPWAMLEDSLADSVKVRQRAAYILTGPLYSSPLHFVKDTGRVAIPDATWKIAILGPDPYDVPFTVASLQTWNDVAQLRVYAVLMPNVAGIRNVPWRSYLTTIDAIEAATGYDFLSLLPQAFQSVLEGTDKPPVASTGGPYNTTEGVAFGFAPGSTYPSGDPVQFSWTFGDGATSTDASPTHTYANDGSFDVTLTITDPYGANTTSSTTITVANVAPELAAISNATILRGETFAATGSFSDPGADTWTATVNYDDGAGVQSLTLSDKDFELSHTYATAGTFTIVVTVNDDDTSSHENIVVTVLTPLQGISNLTDMVVALGADGAPLNQGLVASLRAKLEAASAQARQKNDPESANILNAFIGELQGLVNGGQLDAAAAQPIIDYAQRVIGSL